MRTAIAESIPVPESSPVHIPGYRVGALVNHTERASIYHGTREHDGIPVILKVLRDRALTAESAATYRHEYEILQRLRSEGVIKAYELCHEPTAIALILEDIGGLSLKQLIDARDASLTLGKKLHLALKLVAAIRDVHTANIIHKDINPNNVIVDLRTDNLKLIDFGLATPLAREQATTAIPTSILGTLPYIAPEQTGRMNRAVDYRSDFYSLGATLYELFAGRPPFAGNDALELIHAHIARQPAAPHELNAHIPQVVSSIVMKLLAKNAEDRYQSIWSLEHDLQRCLQDWCESGGVATFAIDQSKVRDRFELPQKLYGRETEVATLLAAFDAVSDATPKALFITGHSGIGKTSLVREIYKPVTAKRGFLAAGKFDQYERNIPYSAILSAVNELIRQLLSEPEERIARWRASLEGALGASGRALTDLLPDLELIIGPQPPIPTIGAKETQERLSAAFRRLFRAICRPEHPVVLYLDDVQWADNASLTLMRQVLTDEELRSFLFVAAYRDHDLDTTHPVSLTIEQLRRQAVPTETIALSPLGVDQITQLLSDTFDASPDQTQALADLVHSKTNGNPFFVDEFLKSLYVEGLVYFDSASHTWRWDLEAIVNAEVTDNVVELMARNIRELPTAGQHVLRLAACIGTVFDSDMLARVAEMSIAETVQALNEAILHGFVIPLDETYRWTTVGHAQDAWTARFRFAHDRVRQAAYDWISQRDRAAMHYRIGRLLSADLDQPRGKELLQIVNHLNAGRSHASAPERLRLAELNLAAGRQVRATGAYEAAYAYFKTGIAELNERSWNENYELTLALSSETAATAPLCEDYVELELRFAAVRRYGRAPLDKMPVYESKIAAEMFLRRDLQAAGETGLEALRLLGVHFPARPNNIQLLLRAVRAKFALWGRTAESLLDNRRMTDPLRIAESRLLLMLCNVFHWSNPKLLTLTLYRFLYICVKHGNSDAAPSVYAYYAMSLCAGKNADKGYRFGQLALALLEKLDARDQRPWVACMVHANVEHWKQHARRSLPALLESYRDAMDVGDMAAAGMALISSGFISFHLGEPLSSLSATLQSFIGTLQKTVKDKRGAGILELYRDAIACLTGTEGRENSFSAAPDSEAYRLAERKHRYTYHFFRGFLAFHFGDYSGAHDALQQARHFAHSVVGIVRFGDMYEALSRVMVHAQLDKRAQKENLAAIVRTQERLKIFAHDCPGNYLHRWHLVAAEAARLRGRNAEATEHYDQSIEAARASGHVHEEALANELAARYYFGTKKNKIAQTYMSDAKSLYQRWGATRKTEWLTVAYPELTTAAAPETMSLHTPARSQIIATANLDLPALMKALKAIAEKTVHSQILQETIHIVMQFAGAEKALLLLRDAGDALLIEADADAGRVDAELMKSIPFEQSARLSQAVVNYARRTKSSVVIHDAQEPQSLIPGLQNDRYVREHGVKSVLCIPVTVGADQNAELIGLLYVENNRSGYAFTEQRVEILQIICLSVAGRLELSRKAVTDSLTGLYNRGYFQSNVTKEFSAARRKQRPLSLVMVDIDHFKKINDNWGHQVGDAVLRHVAKTLKSGCRESDVPVRYGGEEMVLILPETNAEQAVEVAERLRRTLEEQPARVDGQTIPATASLGVATNDPRHDTAELLIESADRALYESKKNGRNRVTVA